MNPIITTFKNGNTKCIRYMLNGVLHRLESDGPAFVEYYESKNIKFEGYFMLGKINRTI